MEDFCVLIVDDEQEFRELTIKRIIKRGLRALGAGSGQEALEVITNNYQVDVVLLDVKMPGMDGIETLRHIRAEHPLIEVILLTGHASVESGIEGMKLGAFDYLMKPIELEPLLLKLAKAYEKKRKHEQKIEEAQIKKFMSLPT